MHLQPWSMAATTARQTTSHTLRCTAGSGRASQIVARARGAGWGCAAAVAALTAPTTAWALVEGSRGEPPLQWLSLIRPAWGFVLRFAFVTCIGILAFD